MVPEWHATFSLETVVARTVPLDGSHGRSARERQRTVHAPTASATTYRLTADTHSAVGGRPSPPLKSECSCGVAESRTRSCHRSCFSSRYSCALRRSCALIATITVLADINTAPTAGESTKPSGARTPAASGMAKML